MLVDFLKNKHGFCQQYAAAEAVMLRDAGIPSRVVLGYMHPAPDPDGSFQITSADAHAWVEAYFTGIGLDPVRPDAGHRGLVGGPSQDTSWAPHSYSSRRQRQRRPEQAEPDRQRGVLRAGLVQRTGEARLACIDRLHRPRRCR